MKATSFMRNIGIKKAKQAFLDAPLFATYIECIGKEISYIKPHEVDCALAIDSKNLVSLKELGKLCGCIDSLGSIDRSSPIARSPKRPIQATHFECSENIYVKYEDGLWWGFDGITWTSILDTHDLNFVELSVIEGVLEILR